MRVSLLLASLALCSLAGCIDMVANGGSQSAAKAEIEVPAPNAELRAKINRVLAETERRYLRSNEQDAWQVLHGALAFGRGTKLVDPSGRLVPAIDYLFSGQPLRGWNLRPAEQGVHAVLEQGSKSGQGHKDQWIGYLAASGDLRPDMPLVVGGKQYKAADLLSQAQWECTEGMEAGWTLMGLHPFVELDSEWTARDGQKWTLERLIAMESRADLSAAACGGTHSLTGVAMCLNAYLAAHPELNRRDVTGGWHDARDRVDYAINTARQYQQPDGSFSVNYFIRPGTSSDLVQKLGTTGHTLEFLTYALSDDQLREPWIIRAVDKLCDLMEATHDVRVECGALYHAAHGLVIYRQRMFPDDHATAEKARAAQMTLPGDEPPPAK